MALADIALMGASDDLIGRLGDIIQDVDILGDDELMDVALLGDVLYGPLDDDELIGDDELEGIFDSIAKAVKSVGKVITAPIKVAGKVLKSPIAKTIVGGIGVVFPPALPVSAGIVLADRALRVAEGTKGTAKQQTVMKAALKRTTAAAKKGDPAAQKTVEYLASARRMRLQSAKVSGAAAEPGLMVTAQGRIKRGRFRAA